jgi:Cu-Zn family superoxide dismutase
MFEDVIRMFCNSHVGDLGNVAVDSNGVVFTEFTDDVISLVGNLSVIGRSFVVSEYN